MRHLQHSPWLPDRTLPASRTVKISVVPKPPSVFYFVIAAQTDEDTTGLGGRAIQCKMKMQGALFKRQEESLFLFSVVFFLSYHVF